MSDGLVEAVTENHRIQTRGEYHLPEEITEEKRGLAMVSRRFHAVSVVRAEIVEPLGVVVGQLPSQYLLKEELEILLRHLPVNVLDYLQGGPFIAGHVITPSISPMLSLWAPQGRQTRTCLGHHPCPQLLHTLTTQHQSTL